MLENMVVKEIFQMHGLVKKTINPSQKEHGAIK